jgi:chromosome segregation ATPase
MKQMEEKSLNEVKELNNKLRNLQEIQNIAKGMESELEEYTTKISQLESTNSDLAEEISHLKSQLADKQKSLTEISVDKDKLNSTLQKLKEDYSKQVIFFILK